jgi:hypothetical protein
VFVVTADVGMKTGLCFHNTTSTSAFSRALACIPTQWDGVLSSQYHSKEVC